MDFGQWLGYSVGMFIVGSFLPVLLHPKLEEGPEVAGLLLASGVCGCILGWCALALVSV